MLRCSIQIIVGVDSLPSAPNTISGIEYRVQFSHVGNAPTNPHIVGL